MAFGKAKEPKEPKAPKKPKKEKPPKAPKEKKPKKPKKEKPPRAAKGKKGKNAPEAVEGQEGEQAKKKLPLPLLIISLAVIVAAAVIVFLFVIRPRLAGDPDEDPDATVSVEPQPPELPEKIPIGDDVEITGMTLGADESGALAEKAKTITYTYSNLVDAGKAAETYVTQLAQETPAFALVDEEFVRQTEKPDYTAAEGMVLLARNVPAAAAEPESMPQPEESAEPTDDADPDGSAEPTSTPEPTPEPEPTPPPVTYVHTVRISWSPGICVVTADEQEGQVTSPPPTAAANHSVSQHGAKQILQEMDPAQLELTGASMDEYEVMPVDGAEMVDDRPCIRLYVYSDNNQPNSNEIMGSYLMSIDGEHLYKVDPITDEIKELDYTP